MDQGLMSEILFDGSSTLFLFSQPKPELAGRAGFPGYLFQGSLMSCSQGWHCRWLAISAQELKDLWGFELRFPCSYRNHKWLSHLPAFVNNLDKKKSHQSQLNSILNYHVFYQNWLIGNYRTSHLSPHFSLYTWAAPSASLPVILFYALYLEMYF